MALLSLLVMLAHDGISVNELSREITCISEDLRGLRPHRRKKSPFAYGRRFSDVSAVENLGGLVAAVSYR